MGLEIYSPDLHPDPPRYRKHPHTLALTATSKAHALLAVMDSTLKP